MSRLIRLNDLRLARGRRVPLWWDYDREVYLLPVNPADPPERGLAVGPAIASNGGWSLRGGIMEFLARVFLASEATRRRVPR